MTVNYSDTTFRLPRSKAIKEIASTIINTENRLVGNISFIFVSDNELLDINRQFLQHDYYTDVITFNYNEGNIVNGEIYMSIDTIRNNAKTFHVSLLEECHRVMIHGILHLCGYNDTSNEEREQMRLQEERWLTALKTR